MEVAVAVEGGMVGAGGVGVAVVGAVGVVEVVGAGVAPMEEAKLRGGSVIDHLVRTTRIGRQA